MVYERRKSQEVKLIELCPKLTVNLRLEANKFVLNGKTSCRQSVPQSISSWNEFVRMDVTSWNTNGMVLICVAWRIPDIKVGGTKRIRFVTILLWVTVGNNLSVDAAEFYHDRQVRTEKKNDLLKCKPKGVRSLHPCAYLLKQNE